MASAGGGAESVARKQQYDYRANSSLVLTSESRTRDAHDPSGEPESLYGKMGNSKMGDRVTFSKPPELEERRKKADEKRRKREEQNGDVYPRQQRRKEGVSVLDLENLSMYQPRTRETRQAYDAMLDLIREKVGDQPSDVLNATADEILSILKSQKLKDPERETQSKDLLGSIETEEFAKLVAIGKRITDWTDISAISNAQNNDENGEGAIDDQIGVAVEFDDEDDNEFEGDGGENRILDEVVGSSDDEDDRQKKQNYDSYQQEGEQEEDGQDMNLTADMDMDVDTDDADDGLKVQEIDAYWLQRRINQTYEGENKEPEELREMSDSCFQLMEDEELNGRERERGLIALFDQDKFELVRELLKNRLKIVWCTRRARAQTEEDKKRIENEMGGSNETRKILEAIYATRGTVKERQDAMTKAMREEAKKLMSGEQKKRNAKTENLSKLVTERNMVDFETLGFGAGAHFMSNKKVQLPDKSFRTSKKGYEEVHVPAMKAAPVGKSEKMVKIADMPKWAQVAFGPIQRLNRVQSAVYEQAMHSSENMLLCAPTGSGKTLVALLAVLNVIGRYLIDAGTKEQSEVDQEAQGEEGEGSDKKVEVDLSQFKIVYISPMKALVAEQVGSFTKFLTPYGITVRELTGDVNLTRQEIEATQVIVTTPEKWDIVTRKSGERTYVNLVRLVILDEVHLLHDLRGPVLEAVVARTLRQVEASREMVRIVGLSATLPNYQDVASFLRVDSEKGMFYFDNSYRPVPLSQQYVGISIKKPLQRFQLMNDICYEKVLDYAGKHQILIFVHSRKETAKTAKFIKDRSMKEETLNRFIKEDGNSSEILKREAENCRNLELRELLPFGFAIHHAGMGRADRTLVEDLFADERIQVLVSTATLAWGVNLPAHTVIVKGTQVYSPERSSWEEISPMDLMQMMGRAGRPQYMRGSDDKGEGIVITTHSQLQYYLSLLNNQLPIESQFPSTIPDNLNAEVVLGTVLSVQDAAHWLGYTYMYVRMLREPGLYGVPLRRQNNDSDRSMLEQRLDLAHSAAIELEKHGMLRYDRRTGNLQVTDLGRIASGYYVSYQSAARYSESLKPTMGDIELLRVFSASDEFKYMVVREEEKLELAKLVDKVPIPIKESIEEPSAKVNVLLQAYISRASLTGLALGADMVYVTQSAGRLIRCLFEICLRRGWAALADRALTLCKEVQQRQWSVQTPLRQYKGVPVDVLSRLEKKDLPWERYFDLTSQQLGELIRNPKSGKLLHKLIHQFPRMQLEVSVQPITRSVLKLDVSITPDFQWEERVHGTTAEPFWIFVEDQDSERILHSEYFLLKRNYIDVDHQLSFTVAVQDPLPPQYFVRAVSDRWLQCETTKPISFRHLILPEKFPPPTELLDLQPLPISALKNPSFEKVLRGRISEFNPVQTQVFTALYGMDDNCLVAAPTGSGKTHCAELAVFRMIQKAQQDANLPCRCVFIAPLDQLAKERYEDWQVKFGQEGLGLEVVMLVGESSTDLKLLEKGNIIISTPERWDMISRRWKQRRNVQRVSLYIIDELHFIGGQKGPVIEVITSRMRYISSQLEAAENPHRIRIVGFCCSVANARDLGEWIGATSHGLYNFSPLVRPVPLEIHIQGFDIVNFEARMQAMARPCYSAICQYGFQKKVPDPVVVFAPTRKHCLQCVNTVLLYAEADGEPDKFKHVPEESEETFKALVQKVNDARLQRALQQGVAYLHENMQDGDKHTVRLLFDSGAVQVLVATAAMCWGMTSNAHCVVIMGTQYYDASGMPANDYSVTDLLQMMGRASRPQKDDQGICVLMCQTSKKEYYKKFLFEAFPVESHLDHFLHDHLVSEVVTTTIENKQDVVDYLTWTFFYRRLVQNPNYYGMQGSTHRHISDHLSELAETTLSELESSKVIAIEKDYNLEALNLGMIAAYYYITYTTIELFSASLQENTKMKGLLEILSHAAEFSSVPVRPGEEEMVKSILMHAPLALSRPRYEEAATKINALLQAHFSRKELGGDLAVDQRWVVVEASRLLQAVVDVLASSGWLNPALSAMEMAQMIAQGLWDKDSPLMQIPHIDSHLSKVLTKSHGLESVFDLVEAMEDKTDAEIAEMLTLQDFQVKDVKKFCSRYPDIDLKFQTVKLAPNSERKRQWISAGLNDFSAGDQVGVQIELERDFQGQELPPVDAPRYPRKKDETWWLVIGDPKQNSLLAIKRVNFGRKTRPVLDFMAPDKAGITTLTLYFMSDCYMGADQEYEIELDIQPLKEDEDSGMEDV